MDIILEILKSVLLLSAMGLLFGLGLSVAYNKLAVKPDERVEKVRDNLPGANCGGCGYAGCDAFAEALVQGKAQPSQCVVVSSAQREAVNAILGTEDGETVKRRAFVACHGGRNCLDRYAYNGMSDCVAANLVNGSPKACTYACLGLGSCVKACPFDAVHINDNGVAEVRAENCVGCGKCMLACPRGLIYLIPADAATACACRTDLRGKDARDICSSACIGCGLCVKNCGSGAITMENNLPHLDYTKCDGCGKCAEKCPTGVIQSFVNQSYDETEYTK